MSVYRLFKLAPDGWVIEAKWIEATNDDEAAKAAIIFGAGERCEIWERDRLVGMTEPFGKGSPTFCPRWATTASPYATST